MDRHLFRRLAEEELARVPPRFAHEVQNVAVLIEEAPSREVLRAEGLDEDEVPLGLYRGIPKSERGAYYSGALPDTITLYRLPLLEEAKALLQARRAKDIESGLRLAIRETLWHELGHYFGLDDPAIHKREDEGTNEFK